VAGRRSARIETNRKSLLRLSANGVSGSQRCVPSVVGDHEQMLGRTSLLILGALSLAVVGLAGYGGSASHALPTTSDDLED
jgi:hypothetical protein